MEAEVCADAPSTRGATNPDPNPSPSPSPGPNPNPAPTLTLTLTLTLASTLAPALSFTLTVTPDAPSMRGAICRRGSGAVVRHGGRAEGRPRLLNRHHHRLLRARSPDDPRVCAEGAAVCSCRKHSTAHAAGWPRWAEAQGGLQDGLALEACSGAARRR